MKKSGTRHRARRRAIDLLFEAEAKDVSPTTLIAQRREVFPTDDSVGMVSAYTEACVVGVTEDQAQIDAVLTSHLKEWTLPRLPAVDRAILRLATWELFHSLDVPPTVAVDEAVQLAKELSTDESPGFVNGVLDALVVLAPQVRSAASAAGASETPG